MTRGWKTVALFLAIFFCAGCATHREQKAFEEFNREKEAWGTWQRSTPEGEELPDLDADSTLSDYLLYAALNNDGLKAAFLRWKATLEKIPQVRSLPDPRFTYAYFLREVETRVGPQHQKFGLSQAFPWFGTLELRGQVAMQAANVARARYESYKRKLFYQVKSAYYEFYFAARTIAVTEDNIQLMTHLEGVARTRYKAGRANHGDVIKAQVELGVLEDRLRALHDLRDPLAARLNAALGRPVDSPFLWPKVLPHEAVTLSADQLLAWMKENNPDLKAVDFTVAKERKAGELAKKNYYPDITLGVEYIDTRDARMHGTKDSGKDPVVGMISVNLPLWHGKYRAAERESNARANAALKERRNKEISLSADLKMTLFKFRDAERKIDLYRDTLVPKAKQSLNAIQQAFTTGKAGFLDLVDGQRTLLEFQLSYERAQVDRAQSLAKIEMLIGRDVPHKGLETNKDEKGHE